jgi:hypothetical protein
MIEIHKLEVEKLLLPTTVDPNLRHQFVTPLSHAVEIAPSGYLKVLALYD